MFEKGYMSLGVRVYTAFPLAFVLGGSLLVLISIVSFGIFVGPCFYGLAWMTRRAMRGDEISLADAFVGFEERLGTNFIAGLAFLVMLLVTSPFWFIPAPVVAALLIWMFPLLVDDEKATFTDAFGGALAFIEHDVLNRGIFAIVIVLVGWVGFVPGFPFFPFLILGLFTSSWAVVTISAAYFREQHPREKVYLPEPRAESPGDEAGSEAAGGGEED